MGCGRIFNEKSIRVLVRLSVLVAGARAVIGGSEKEGGNWD